MLWCNISYAKVIDFKCSGVVTKIWEGGMMVSELKEVNKNYSTIHIRLDTGKSEIIYFRPWADKKDIYKISEANDNSYLADSIDKSFEEHLTLNRYTGELRKTLEYDSPKKYVQDIYSCEPTKQLY